MPRAIAVAALVMLWAGAARAQQTLTLAGELPLARLLDACAERLGAVIEYQPKVLTETVTLRGAVSDAELWDLTNRLLAARGFTTIRVGESEALGVVRLRDAGGAARIQSPLDPADPLLLAACGAPPPHPLPPLTRVGGSTPRYPPNLIPSKTE
ncbi:MAG: hypothetical protein H6811_05980 [Phycisphaeraceae bacterium]|nr:hypothetical protein [Phycisphaeraceae bacterium]